MLHSPMSDCVNGLALVSNKVTQHHHLHHQGIDLTLLHLLSFAPIQLASDVFNPLTFVFLLTSIVNKSCSNEFCVNTMLQIFQNIMISQGLELELTMFRRTTMSGQHPLIEVWVQNFQNYSTPCSHYISMGAGG